MQADLVSTIGESAAMGTAGVIIWERSEMKLEVNGPDFKNFRQTYKELLVWVVCLF